MSVAAMLSGMALVSAALGAVHGFSGPLGGMFDAPHGALCAAVLPYVVEVNERAVKERFGRTQAGTLPRRNGAASRPTRLVPPEVCETVAQRFEEVRRIVGNLGELVQELKMPPLRQYGVTPGDFPSIIEKAKAANSMKGNPVVLRDEELREILERSL
jgi:alcohol dehydrogenase class IV